MNGRDLRIVFMGTPDFAVASLELLVKEGYQVVGVVTAPDKPAGRGQKMQQSAVKLFATSHQIPVLQPEKLKNEDFVRQLTELRPDLQVVVAFRMLPEVVWQLPPMGTFNLHGSLLPRYRGAAPLNWAILNGDTESGVTTFLLKQEIDTGNILFKEAVPVSQDMSVGELHDILMGIGARLVLKTVDAIASGDYIAIPQESLPIDSTRIHAPKIFKEDCRLDFNQSVTFIHNKVRGLSPYPTAWTELKTGNGETINLKVFRGKPELGLPEHLPGTLISDQKKWLRVACQDGYFSITELQLAGKKRLAVEDFLRGFAIPSESRLI